MRLVTVKMPEVLIEALDELVRMGRYGSRSEAIRVAVRELLARELFLDEAVKIAAAVAKPTPYKHVYLST